MLTGSSSFEKCLMIHHPRARPPPSFCGLHSTLFYHLPKWAMPPMPLKNKTPSTFVWIITSQPSPFDGSHWTICLRRMWKGILYKSINLKLVWLTVSRPHAIGILFPSAICAFHATLVSTGNNNNILWATYVHANWQVIRIWLQTVRSKQACSFRLCFLRASHVFFFFFHQNKFRPDTAAGWPAPPDRN